MDTPIIHPNLGSNVSLRTVSAGGKPGAAFAQADHVVRQAYQVQRLAPAHMETRGVIAEYQPEEDLLTVWDSTQHPHKVREHLVHLLGRAEVGIRVVAPDVGGGFSEKGACFPRKSSSPTWPFFSAVPSSGSRTAKKTWWRFTAAGIA